MLYGGSSSIAIASSNVVTVVGGTAVGEHFVNHFDRGHQHFPNGIQTGALPQLASGMSAIDWMFIALAVFVVVSSAFAIVRCLPKRAKAGI